MQRALVFVALCLTLRPAASFAQEGRLNVGVTAISVAADGPAPLTAHRAFSPELSVGWRVAPQGTIELSAGWIRARGSGTFAGPAGQPEATFSVATEAFPIAAAYRQSFHITGVGPRPFAAAGLVLARVSDTYEVDTPPESFESTLFGFQAELGVVVPLLRRAGLTVRAGYRRLERDEPGDAFQLSGPMFGAGLQLQL